jgi:excisionase family DNA binding protein
MRVPPGKTTFTLPEAAKLLSCHRETLRRAIRTGELQAAKLGREFRISRFDLQAFWTASGGGDLFGSEADADSEAEREKKPAGRQGGGTAKGGGAARKSQQQFSLPGTAPESGGKAGGPETAAARRIRVEAQGSGASPLDERAEKT